MAKKKELNSVSNLKIIPLGGLEQIGESFFRGAWRSTQGREGKAGISRLG